MKLDPIDRQYDTMRHLMLAAVATALHCLDRWQNSISIVQDQQHAQYTSIPNWLSLEMKRMREEQRRDGKSVLQKRQSIPLYTMSRQSVLLQYSKCCRGPSQHTAALEMWCFLSLSLFLSHSLSLSICTALSHMCIYIIVIIYTYISCEALNNFHTAHIGSTKHIPSEYIKLIWCRIFAFVYFATNPSRRWKTWPWNLVQ